MSVGSIITLAVVGGLVLLALRRVRKRGTPCHCGKDRTSCPGGCPGCSR